MTLRPERLKATRLHVPIELTEKSEPSERNNDYPNLKQTHGTQKMLTKETYLVNRPKETSKNTEISNAVRVLEPHNSKSQPVIQQNGNVESTAFTGKQEGLPKGFVSRSEMKDKLTNRKSIRNENQYNSGKPNITEHVKGVPPGFVTKKEMESRLQKRKTKSTKVTTTYTNIQITERTTQGQRIRRYYTGENGPEIQNIPKQFPITTHIFSKLENKDRAIPVSQERSSETRSNKRATTPNQTPTVGSKDYAHVRKVSGTKPQLPVSKASGGEKVASTTTEAQSIKTKIGSDIIDSDRIRTASTTKSSNMLVTPRNTSTAIPKASRQEAKTKHTPQIQMESVKILIMNANGKNDKSGSPAERRKNAIQNVVVKHMPNIALFQEFSWAGITGKTWSKYPFPEQFVYKGHSHASIMYDKTFITVQNLPASDIDTILAGLQRNSNNRLKRTFPMDFNPVARMSILRVTAPTKPGLDFICISWHGKSNETNGGRMKELKKIEYFEYWIEFLRNVREKYKLPILAAGDYNVDMYSIEKFVQSPFKLCIYEASMRRTVRAIVDYCIVTDDLEFTDITWVNLERDTSAFHPNGILDHDPIVGSLTVSAIGAAPAAMGIGKKKAWPSPIAKL